MSKSEFVQNAIAKSLKTLAPALQAGGTTIRGFSGHRVQVVLHEDFTTHEWVELEAGHG